MIAPSLQCLLARHATCCTCKTQREGCRSGGGWLGSEKTNNLGQAAIRTNTPEIHPLDRDEAVAGHHAPRKPDPVVMPVCTGRQFDPRTGKGRVETANMGDK
jgi:hypothetical protein